MKILTSQYDKWNNSGTENIWGEKDYLCHYKQNEVFVKEFLVNVIKSKFSCVFG